MSFKLIEVLKRMFGIFDRKGKIKRYLIDYLEESNLAQSALSLEQELESPGHKVENEIKVHIIGDSHAHGFTGTPSGTYGIGLETNFPWTSYSLSTISTKELLRFKWVLLEKLFVKYNIEVGSSLMFTFGEPECRWHVFREAARLKIGTDEELINLADEYVTAAFEIFNRLLNLGYKVIIWGGQPTPEEERVFLQEIPFLGSAKSRNLLTKYWHEAMEKYSLSKSIPFISIYEQMEGKDGSALEFYMEDSVHVKTTLLQGFLATKLYELKII